jgi:alpha-tubulin suppressor-like RCC1 family protein
VKEDGTLWLIPQYPHAGIGRYERQQLGTGTNWQRVICGPNYFLAERNDGSWWAYGGNDYGQAGNGTQQRISELSRLPFGFEPLAMGLGEMTAVLLTTDGAVWSWGVRLGGEFRVQRLPKVKQGINRLTAQLPWPFTIFKHSPWPIDFEPTTIWSFPQSPDQSGR